MLLGPFISTKVKKAFPPRAGTLRPTILGSGERAEAMAARAQMQGGQHPGWEGEEPTGGRGLGMALRVCTHCSRV